MSNMTGKSSFLGVDRKIGIICLVLTGIVMLCSAMVIALSPTATPAQEAVSQIKVLQERVITLEERVEILSKVNRKMLSVFVDLDTAQNRLNNVLDKLEEKYDESINDK